VSSWRRDLEVLVRRELLGGPLTVSELRHRVEHPNYNFTSKNRPNAKPGATFGSSVVMSHVVGELWRSGLLYRKNGDFGEPTRYFLAEHVSCSLGGPDKRIHMCEPKRKK
jgi:hypothetical protein